jgi:hypothetical protein
MTGETTAKEKPITGESYPSATQPRKPNKRPTKTVAYFGFFRVADMFSNLGGSGFGFSFKP